MLQQLARASRRRAASAGSTRAASTAVSYFDKALKLQQRRAALSPEFDYLHDAVAARLVERLNDVKRAFPVALDLGANTGNIVKQLAGHGGIETLHMLDSCKEKLYRDEASWSQRTDVKVVPVVSDEEARLPFEDGSLDLVMSSCSLHWQNDLPAIFAEVRRVLRPDGVFLAAMLGGETLAELRSAFIAGQTEREGGVSPHTSPMAGITDVGNLLAAAGFGIPTIDGEAVRVEYPHALRLCEHLQGMGENGAALQRQPTSRRDTMLAMAAIYHKLYTPPAPEPGAPVAADDGGSSSGISATFDIVYLIGWSPADSQPKPLRRGSVARGLGARPGQPPNLPA